MSLNPLVRWLIISSCFTLYNNYFSALGNVIVVVKNDTRPPKEQVNDTILVYASIIPEFNNWQKNQWAIQNVTWVSSELLGSKVPEVAADNWFIGAQFYEADYCYIQLPASIDGCTFEYSSQIMITVCTLNLLKACTILVIWLMLKYRNFARQDDEYKHENAPLHILGDAIQSFLQRPEPKTTSMCLAAKDSLETQSKPDITFLELPLEWQ